MWHKFSPYNRVEPDNPVFQQEQRRLRWLKTPEILLKYNFVVWIGIPALILLWWLVERIGLGFTYAQPDFQNRPLLIVLIVSAGLMILSSFYILITTIGRVHRQFHAGDWETLGMTNQHQSTILDAKNAIARIQAWPFIAAEIGLRTAFVLIFTLNSFYDWYHISADKSLYIQTTFLNLLCWSGWWLILAMGLTFILEPWLRMRLLIGCSTALALQVKHLPLSLLSGFATTLIFLLTPAAFLGGLGTLFNNFVNEGMVGIGIACIFVPVCVLATVLFYGFYIGINKMSHNFIRRKAFAPD